MLQWGEVLLVHHLRKLPAEPCWRGAWLASAACRLSNAKTDRHSVTPDAPPRSRPHRRLQRCAAPQQLPPGLQVGAPAWPALLPTAASAAQHTAARITKQQLVSPAGLAEWPAPAAWRLLTAWHSDCKVRHTSADCQLGVRGGAGLRSPAHGQAIRLAHGRQADYADAEVQVPHHASEHLHRCARVSVWHVGSRKRSMLPPAVAGSPSAQRLPHLGPLC